MTTLETVSHQDSLLAAAEPYRRYLLAVQMLHDPYAEAVQPLHTAPGEPINPQAIAKRATGMLWHGLRDAVRDILQAKGDSGNLHSQAHSFHSHSDTLHAFVRQYYEEYAGDAAVINPAFQSLRPAPFLDSNLYKQLCENRAERLTAVRLMGDIVLNDCFRGSVDQDKSQVIGVIVPRKDIDTTEPSVVVDIV